MSEYELTDEQLRAIYAWIDAIPLSRPKRNMARDFSDGVLLAEVVAAYFPHLVEVHNYPAANSTKQKIYNHETLNQRVLKKLNLTLPKSTIEDIVNCKPGAVESTLHTLQIKMAKYRERKPSEEQRSPISRAVEEQQQAPEVRPRPKQQQQQQQQQQQSTPQQQASNNSNNNNNKKDNNSNRRAPQDGGARDKSSHPPVRVHAVTEELLLEKEQQIRELNETVEILELKVAKLEQLVRLKDSKIQKLLDA